MYVNVTVKTVEDFIDEYLTCYAKDWNKLAEEEKLFLVFFLIRKIRMTAVIIQASSWKRLMMQPVCMILQSAGISEVLMRI